MADAFRKRELLANISETCSIRVVGEQFENVETAMGG